MRRPCGQGLCGRRSHSTGTAYLASARHRRCGARPVKTSRSSSMSTSSEPANFSYFWTASCVDAQRTAALRGFCGAPGTCAARAICSKFPAGSTGTHKQEHLDRSVPLFLAPLDRVVAAVLRHAGVAASVCGENHVDSRRSTVMHDPGITALACTPVAPVDILQPQPKLKNAFTSAATATAAADSSRAADLQGEAEGGPGSSADPLGRGAFPLAIIPKKTAHAT